MLVRGAAFLLRGFSMGLGFLVVILIVLSDGLEMVIGCRDVTGCSEVMLLARHVALGVRHDGFLAVDENRKN